MKVLDLSLFRPGHNYVYLCLSAKKELLYAGATENLLGRLASHSISKTWFSRVRYVLIQECDTILNARALERVIINTGEPEFNILGTVDNWKPRFSFKRELKKDQGRRT